MESPSAAPPVSPNTLASLITSYVQRGSLEAEVRARKALSILHARDRQVEELQRRISELEGFAGRLEAEVPLLKLPPSPEDEPQSIQSFHPLFDREVPGMLRFMSSDSDEEYCSSIVAPSIESSGAQLALQGDAPHSNAVVAFQHASCHLADDVPITAPSWPKSPATREAILSEPTPSSTSRFTVVMNGRAAESEPREVHARCHQVIDELKRYNNQLRTALEGAEEMRQQAREEYGAILNRVQSMVERHEATQTKFTHQASQTSTQMKEVFEVGSQAVVEMTASGTQTDDQALIPVEQLKEHPEYKLLSEEKLRLKDMCQALQTKYETLQDQYDKLQEQFKQSEEAHLKALKERIVAKKEEVDADTQTEALTTENENTVSSSSRGGGDEEEVDSGDKSDEAEERVKQMYIEKRFTFSMSTQTDNDTVEECDCTGTISDVPPQWLLEAALRRTMFGRKRAIETIVEENKSDIEVDSQKPSQKLDGSTLSSFTKELIERERQFRKALAEKEEEIARQEETIGTLADKLRHHGQRMRDLGKAAAMEVENERIRSKEAEAQAKAKIFNICRFIVEKFGLPISPTQLLESSCEEEEDSDEYDSGDRTKSAVRLIRLRPSNSKNKDEEKLLGHLNGLRGKLRNLGKYYSKAQQEVSSSDDGKHLCTESSFEKALVKMREELEELQKQIMEMKSEKGCFTLRTIDQDKNTVQSTPPSLPPPAEPEPKTSKQSENLRTQRFQTRLRAANQTIMTLNKTINAMKQEGEMAQLSIASLRSRLSRSESCNQNRLVLIDNYKAKIQDLEQRLSAANNLVSTQKDALGNLKTQIFHLKIQISKTTQQRNEYLDQIHRIKTSMNEEISRAITDMEQRVKQEVAQHQMKEVRSYYKRQVSQTEQKLKEASHQVQEFTTTVEIFLKLVQDHTIDKNAEPTTENSSRREAQEIACSILNLTPSQLQALASDSSEASSSRQQELTEWTNYCKKLFQMDNFSQNLAEFLFKVVLTHFEPEVSEED